MAAPLPVSLLTGLVVAGVGLIAPGGALLVRGIARTSGVFLVLAGVGVLGLVASGAATGWSIAAKVWCCAAEMLLAIAVLTYPRWGWRDGATYAAVAVVLAAPLLVVGVLSHGPNAVGNITYVMAAVPLAQLWWRLETVEAQQRRAISWMLVSLGAVVFMGLGVSFYNAPDWLIGVTLAAFALVGAAAWIGVTAPAVVDVRGIVKTVVVNATSVVLVAVVYATVVSIARLVGVRDQLSPGVVGALVAAACFEPGRRQLRLVADELLFGVRPDPLRAVERVALGVGDDPTAALEAVRVALVLPYAALRFEGLPEVSVGEDVEHHHTVPLVVDGVTMGELVVGQRAGDLRMSEDDARVLRLTAPLLAQAARAQAMAQRLQASRELAAGAREEERRRLRRDLHDGLGPRLSGIAFTADAARLSIAEPAEAAAHLARVRSEAVAAIKEIRELVYGLRPPALDEVGLIEALRLHAASLRGRDGTPLAVEIDAVTLPPLAAAVEVAAYRIVVEALTNTARHSGSSWARATLRAGATLSIRVVDAGGSAGPWSAGVGISSMRERAQELGGTLTAAGGVVHAELPL